MKTKLSLAFALAVLGSVAQSVTVYGLSTRNELIRFDSATPGMLQQASFINGLAANESLVGIDFRPATMQLYGLGSFGRLYTLNTSTGVASFVASLTNSVGGGALALSGTEFGIDFNPVPDRLRVTSNLGQNLRINVSTGVTVVDGTLNQAGGNPFIVASAYINNVAGATSTTLYNIDSASDQLKIQNPPNSGTQVVVGSLGVDVTGLAGFDILTQGSTNTAFVALQMAGMSGSRFGTINLATGMVSSTSMIGMDQSSDALAVRDIAVMPVPEPASVAALALGALIVLRRKK
jgi:hypothetical protein